MAAHLTLNQREKVQIFSGLNAPVIQWIEYGSSKAIISVRFWAGVKE